MAALSHRHDWWRVKDEHTPYEWACQLARRQIAPWGPDRDDFRAAVNTARLVIAMAASEVDEDVAVKLIEALRNYSRPDREQPLSPAELQRKHQHG